MTAKAETLLDRVQVAKPCPASWDGMTGDERVRFCGECRMNVYNLSGMTREAAHELVSKAEGRVCIRFFQRSDGTMITRDCPRGLAAVRQRVAVVCTGLAAVLSLALGGLLGWRDQGPRRGAATPLRVVPRPEPERMVMGEMVVRPQPTPTTPTTGNGNAQGATCGTKDE